MTPALPGEAQGPRGPGNGHLCTGKKPGFLATGWAEGHRVEVVRRGVEEGQGFLSGQDPVLF